MSGGGALQQRTTYLISLTLVKVEALEEDGQDARKNGQGGEGEAEAEARPGSGPGGAGGEEPRVREEAVPAPGGMQGPPRGVEDAATQRGSVLSELRDEEEEERPTLSPARDKVPSAGDAAPAKGSEKPLCNLTIPLASERALPHTAADRDSRRGEKTLSGEKTPSALEAKKCVSPSLPGMSPMEMSEPVRTPTRSSFPIRPVGQRPVSLLKSHSSVTTRGRDSRDGRERSPTSAQSLDRKDSRMPTRSPGPCRASWAEASRTEGWRDPRDEADGRARVGMPLEIGGGPVMRDMPRKERLKTGSASLPGPASQPPKPRKGKSRTLDNSDLNILSEDLALTREIQQIQQSQRGSAKDRKMLKFISGIFTKSSSGPAASGPPVYIQRDSSEEEVNIANSQEWTLNRSVPELHLGVLGSLKSGKSALVNKYITGSYVALEKADGGRYKKEALVDGLSHLLLIREEPGAPDTQFSSWVDAVLLVFSLENEASFQELYQLYSQLHSHRADLPVIVVGTQDKITSSNPRVIDDQRARQLCIDVRHSLFYETCATYGFNVDRVFSEAVQKIVAQKKQAALLACKSLPNSPSHSGGSTPGSASFPGQVVNGQGGEAYPSSLPSTPVVSHRGLGLGGEGTGGSATPRSLKNTPHRRPSLFKNRDADKKGTDPKGDLGSGRAISLKQSILWKRSGSSLNKEWKKKYVTLSNNGMLSYHSSSSDYMQNVHGKEIDLLRVTVKVPGKRPPRAVAPAGPCAGPALAPAAGVNGVPKGGPSSSTEGPASSLSGPQLCPSTLTVADDRAGVLSPLGGDKGLQRCSSSLSTKAQSVDALEGVANTFTAKEASQSSPLSDRKKNRRKKSMNQKGEAVVGQAEAKRKMWKLKSFGSLRNINKTEEENADFIVVSFTGQTWHFEAQSLEERDAWVAGIESQILASLQACESGRNKARRSSRSEAVALQAIRNTKGNSLCVDCGAQNPTWASLNLGALICIECSGIHRNLGTHLSRVRSLDLDDWPGELTQVLAAIGNHMANSIWESCTQGRAKPAPHSSREERESWIRAKYEQRLFVPPLGPAPGEEAGAGRGAALRLLSAVNERDLPGLLLLLVHSTKEQINAPPAGPPPAPACSALHAACQLGDVVMTQLLIWYGSDVEARDTQGRTALVFARKTGSKGCVDILLQHGCPNDATPITTPVLSRRSSTASLGRSNSRQRPS